MTNPPLPAIQITEHPDGSESIEFDPKYLKWMEEEKKKIKQKDILASNSDCSWFITKTAVWESSFVMEKYRPFSNKFRDAAFVYSGISCLIMERKKRDTTFSLQKIKNYTCFGEHKIRKAINRLIELQLIERIIEREHGRVKQRMFKLVPFPSPKKNPNHPVFIHPSIIEEAKRLKELEKECFL